MIDAILKASFFIGQFLVLLMGVCGLIYASAAMLNGLIDYLSGTGRVLQAFREYCRLSDATKQQLKEKAKQRG